MSHPAYYRGRPNVFAQTNHTSSSPRTQLCSGFDNDGQECRRPAFGYGGCCYQHKGQSYWLGQFCPSLQQRIDHAKNGRCCGIAESTRRLCNRKISGCTFCHSHRDQSPPTIFHQQVKTYYDLPVRGLELTTTSAQLKEKLMEYCWMRSQWSEQQRKQREDAQEQARKRTEAAQAARERYYREREETRKKEAEDAERKRKQAEAAAERLRQEQEKQRQKEEERERKRKQGERQRWQKEYDRQKKAAENERAKTSPRYAGIIADFCKACDAFNKMSFSASASPSLSFRSIPWPALLPSSEITSDKITWATVDHFFEVVKQSLSETGYKELVESSRRLYHPNRWAARNIYTSVTLPEREKVMKAGMIVSQAVNAIAEATRSSKVG